MANIVKAPGPSGSVPVPIKAPGAAAKVPIAAPGGKDFLPNDLPVQAPGRPVTPTPGSPGAPKPLPPDITTVISGELKVILGWGSVIGANYYNVRRSVISGGPYFIVQSLIGTSFIDTQVSADVNYFYVLSSVGVGGEGILSGEVTARPLPVGIPPGPGLPPAPPGGLTAQGGNSQVTLVWAASSGAVSYEAWRALVSGGPYTPAVTGITALSYVNVGLVNETPYFYVVFARNAGGLSGPSNQATATPGAQVPAILPPTGVTAVAGVNQITVSWDAVSGAASYRLKKSLTSGGPYAVISSLNVITYSDQGLAPGVPGFYVVAAVNDFGTESANSTQVSAIPTGPIIQPPAAPILQVTAGNTQNALTWISGT